MRIEPHDRSARRERDQRGAFIPDDFHARIRRIGPFGHPLEAERRIEAVKIRQSRQKPERVLAHIVAQRAVAKLDDCSRERRMTTGARAFTRQLAESAVNYGQGRGFGSHEQEPEKATGR